MADALLEVQDLRAYIYTRGGVVRTVDGATFSVLRGTFCANPSAGKAWRTTGGR